MGDICPTTRPSLGVVQWFAICNDRLELGAGAIARPKASRSTSPTTMSAPAETDPSFVSSPVPLRYIPDAVEELRLFDMGDERVELRAEELATNTTLKVLSLDRNGIGDAGITALGQALMRNDSLEKLHVSENKFGITGLAAFAAGLKSNKGLKELVLGGNSIGDAGAVAFGESLKVNTSLTWRGGLGRGSHGQYLIDSAGPAR
jgi:Leucine Rich repeat